MVASTVTPTSTSMLLFPPASIEEAASHAQAPLPGQRIPHLVGETPSLATTHISTKVRRHPHPAQAFSKANDGEKGKTSCWQWC
mmetsp:Transcript_11185/g.23608  ORF Transcript_11185/g.23608 Transcript_11185/m.23608 type:complete len:84 (+) Transcript_11185:270-521(+)